MELGIDALQEPQVTMKNGLITLRHVSMGGGQRS